MAVINEWTEAALEKGREQGLSLFLRALRRVFGQLPADVEKQVRQLSPTQLDALGQALPSLSSIQDLEDWLHRFA